MQPARRTLKAGRKPVKKLYHLKSEEKYKALLENYTTEQNSRRQLEKEHKAVAAKYKL